MNSTFKLRRRGRGSGGWGRDGRGGGGRARGRSRTPPAPAGSRPRRAPRTQDASPARLKSTNLSPPSLPSMTDPAASRPPPPLKGQRRSKFSVFVEGGARGPSALEEAQTRGERGGEPGLRGSCSRWGDRAGTPASSSASERPPPQLPLPSPAPLQTFLP